MPMCMVCGGGGRTKCPYCVTGNKICPGCLGSGKQNNEICAVCAQSGRVACSMCGGSGWQRCISCGGTGSKPF